MNEKTQAKSYHFVEDVDVSEITKGTNYWSYEVVEYTHPSISHRTVYHSTNLLALTHHREKLISVLNLKEKRENTNSYSEGRYVKPTLKERLLATKNQKFR